MSGTNRARAMQTGIFIRFVLLMLLLYSAAMPSLAQDADTVPPIIELEELIDGVADRSQVFTVQIAEAEGLLDAILYHRREGQLPFTPAPMKAIGSTGFFSVSIPTDSSDLRTIEYYVQARDLAGNRTVSGYAFAPYKRTLKPSMKPLQQSGSATGSTARLPAGSQPPAERQTSDLPPLLQRRWVQITLGILAVGAVASLAKDDGRDSQVVPLTFNLQ